MTDLYPPPVDQLLTLGEPSFREWVDYRELGLSEEHVPALIELMQDPRLSWEACAEGADELPFWAPAHAWRALGQLRAEAAIEPLVRVLLRDDDDDWAGSEIPKALGMIGPAAIPVVRGALAGAVHRPEPWGAARLGFALVSIGDTHPDARDQAVKTLAGQLGEWENQTDELNAWLIDRLLQLRAVEAAPVMQEVFEAGAVDEFIVGDWEDAQVELGLRAGRTRPRPRYDHGFQFVPRPRKTTPPAPGSDSAAAKSRRLRKSQKQGKKKRR